MKKKLADEIGKAFIRLHCSHSKNKEAISYFESKKKELEDFREIYPSPDSIGYKATTKEISFYDIAISALSENKGEPKTGHWISHREHCENLRVMPSGLGAYEWCSNCDCGIDVSEWHRNNYNFCPNCGADMREPKGEKGTE